MYIVKNALRNIARAKGRNILAGIIIFAIALSSCVALTIRHSASKAEEEGKSLLNIEATISADRTSAMQEAKSGGSDFRSLLTGMESLELDELLKYAESEYVSDFYYTVTSSVNSGSEEFLAIDTIGTTDTNTNDTAQDDTAQDDTAQDDTAQDDTAQDDTAPNDTQQQNDDRMGGDQGSNITRWGSQGDFTIVGYNSESAMTDFISGICTVTEGEVFDTSAADMTCLISDELALYNDLTVGDTITISNPNGEDEVYSLTINGIYNNSQSGTESSNMMFSASSDPANKILTSAATLMEIAEQSEENSMTSTDEDTEAEIETSTALRTSVSGTYVLANTEAYEAFSEDVYALGLDSNYSVTSSDITSYESSLIPLQNLSKFAGVFLIVVLLVGGVILVVLNIFNIRERKYEVGVLTAIGMKKPKVALQFMCELFAVTMVAIIIGTGIGAVVSAPVADFLLESQTTSTATINENTERNFGRMTGNVQDVGTNQDDFLSGLGNNVENYVSTINASTDFSVLLELFGIGLILTVVSSSAAVIFIMRYEPLKILTNRT